jgi:hypothetical protein
MKGLMRSAFRCLLLLAVLLNLGDAPYLDEIFAELAPMQTGLSAASAGDCAKHVLGGRHAHKVRHSGYESLLANVPLIGADLTLAVIESADEVPVSAGFFVSSPPHDAIDRPPRTESGLA